MSLNHYIGREKNEKTWEIIHPLLLHSSAQIIRLEVGRSNFGPTPCLRAALARLRRVRARVQPEGLPS
jgi:hypothetical protein